MSPMDGTHHLTGRDRGASWVAQVVPRWWLCWEYEA